MSRPSDGFEFDELREEFDWMWEFGARMAERIRSDADVHNLVDYVRKLETENEQLKQRLTDEKMTIAGLRDAASEWRTLAESRGRAIDHSFALREENNRLRKERDELRDLAHDMLWCNLVGDCPAWTDKCGQCALRDVEDWARELGVEWEV